MDDGIYNTSTRKFLTAVPVLLFVLAMNSAEIHQQPFIVNLVIVTWLVVAKLPSMHEVRILGINKY